MVDHISCRLRHMRKKVVWGGAKPQSRLASGLEAPDNAAARHLLIPKPPQLFLKP